MKERLNKQHMTLVFGIICAVGLLGVGISYAWWRLSFVQDKANTAVSKCLKLELANQSNRENPKLQVSLEIKETDKQGMGQIQEPICKGK